MSEKRVVGLSIGVRHSPRSRLRRFARALDDVPGTWREQSRVPSRGGAMPPFRPCLVPACSLPRSWPLPYSFFVAERLGAGPGRFLTGDGHERLSRGLRHLGARFEPWECPVSAEAPGTPTSIDHEDSSAAATRPQRRVRASDWTPLLGGRKRRWLGALYAMESATFVFLGHVIFFGRC